MKTISVSRLTTLNANELRCLAEPVAITHYRHQVPLAVLVPYFQFLAMQGQLEVPPPPAERT